MKNRTIRGMLCSIFLLTSFISSAQLNLNGLTFNGTSFAYFNPGEIDVACTGSAFTATVGAGEQQLISGEAIKLCPGFSARTTGSSTSHFRAFVDNGLLDAAILEPAVTTSVPKYDKVEIGINLPQFDTRISNFLTDPLGAFKVATTNYDNSAQGGIILNPYDPEHISVTAVFYRPGSPNTDGIIRHAFYYEKFDDSGVDDWVKDNTNAYEWRLRYSPGETGVWNGFVNVHVNGVLMPETYFFTFTVVDSDNHGFVQVAPNDQYLQYEDGTDYFPVGDNSDFTTPDSDNSRTNCASANCAYSHDHRVNRRYRDDYTKYLDLMSDQANGGDGGNFTRLIMTPWGFEFEWEALGNYHSRQIEMFELDNVFANAEERDVAIELCTLNSVEVDANPTSYWLPDYSDNWEWSPYNNDNSYRSSDPNSKYKGIAGLTNPQDFYTDATARKLYKNKLRYISSRWGYSTSFLVHELMNELDQAVGYWDTVGHAANAEAWVSEMSDYIKNELGDRQLVTVSFLGDGFRQGEVPGRMTTIWSDPNIDLISGHNYMARLDGLRKKAELTAGVWNTYHKPVMFNENDVYPFSITSACGRDALHNILWSSAFSGAFGGGLSWDMERYMVDDWHDAGLDVENEYQGVRSFFEDMDLINYGYYSYGTAKVSASGSLIDSRYENLFLVRHINGSPVTGRDRAYGWVHNRSYNHFTDQDDCAYYDPTYPSGAVGDRIYQPFISIGAYMTSNPAWKASEFTNYISDCSYSSFFATNPPAPASLSSGFALITGLYASTDYTIQFYHTVGTLAGTYEPTYDGIFTTDYLGVANIPVPPTNASNPDWAYVVIQDAGKAANTAGSNDLRHAGELSLTVAPNPSAGIFRVTGDAVKNISELEVTDLYGRKVESYRTDVNGAIVLDLSRQTNGVYLIQAKIGDQIVTQKVVKE